MVRSMKLGIVGLRASKFTPLTEQLAKEAIASLLDEYRPGVVISGGCHLGGVDVWTVEIAKKLHIPTVEYVPEVQRWEGGYKQRNIKIAENSDMVVCVTVSELPERKEKFPWCYHCRTDQHIRSGGCWTVKYARGIGKEGRVVVVGRAV